MKVICINNSRYPETLTLGKSYSVLCNNISQSYILIKNNDDFLYTYPRKFFISIKESRKNKLNMINERDLYK